MFTAKSIIALVAAGAAIASSGVYAAPSRLSDAQFLTLARCDGLATSKALGVSDASAFNDILQAEGARRMANVADRADEARADAMREAGHAGAIGRAGLIAEHDGLCQTFVREAGGAHTNVN